MPDGDGLIDELLSILGITGAELAPLPIRNARTSRVKTLIPLKSVAIVLEGLTPDFGRIEKFCEKIGSTGLYPYAVSDLESRSFDARQFPKSSGYPEDAATGIAAAALAFGLLEAGQVPADVRPIRIRQGRAMGRPSEIAVRFRMGSDGAIAGCWLGGGVRFEERSKFSIPGGEPFAPDALRVLIVLERMLKSGREVFMWKSFLLAAASAAAAVTGANAASPRDELLVTPVWLAAHAADKDHGHSPYRHAPAGYQAKAYSRRSSGRSQRSHRQKPRRGLVTELPPPDELRAQMQALGISDRSRVIVYSENDGIARATRIILTLDAAGFGNRASLLDGGLKGWEASGHAATADATPATTVVLSPLKMQSRIVTADYVQSHLKSPGFTVVDARAPEFYNGEKPGIEGAVPGHIPGAHNIPFTSVSDADGKLKSPEELKAMFIAAGVKPGDHVIAYCHIGIQATAVIFAARTMGIDARLYDGSFQDWSKRGLPVEMPAAAGDQSRRGQVEPLSRGELFPAYSKLM